MHKKAKIQRRATIGLFLIAILCGIAVFTAPSIGFSGAMAIVAGDILALMVVLLLVWE
jgi:hypothetical protein